MKKPTLAVLLLPALMLALPRMIAAHQTPEQVAERYLSTMKARDWAGNAAMVHPAELDSIKAAFMDVARSGTSPAARRPTCNVGRATELQPLSPAEISARFVGATVGQQQEMTTFLQS